MSNIDLLKREHQAALQASAGGPPRPPSNRFFGVGPITDATADEVEGRLLRFEFEAWLEKNYRKLDDRGNDLGPFTAAEIGRSMHRGYPADKILLDMMREIHRYFELPKANRMAVGLGGGHSGVTVFAMHMVTANDADQHVFVDTPRPESDAAQAGGFFRQSWGAQLIELHRYARNGDESRIHFTDREGTIPSADELIRRNIKLFVGVGHETTGATTYTEDEIANLVAWIDRSPQEHHAILDATSMLGAMPWGEDLVRQVVGKCCLFMPFQKAIGGVSGYFVASFTPHALDLIERNQQEPSWAIPRQLKIVVPADPKLPLSGKRSVALGPIYDPEQNKMLGGVINTYSTLAFAETTFGLLRSERRIGPVAELNRRSAHNRRIVQDWTAANPLLQLAVADPHRRGAAVTLLKVNDPGLSDPALHARIIAKSKQLLGYEGLTHPNSEHEKGLDAARYVNAFPGTPGDYRAWIGGIRDPGDVTALLDNLQYAYLRAKTVVLEEELAAAGVHMPTAQPIESRRRQDDPGRVYKVLIVDPVGLRHDAGGEPDCSEVRRHIEDRGGVFHLGPIPEQADLEKGRIHFFYQPHLSTEAEILPQTDRGQYDAVIAAATFIPKTSVFPLGGVRIGAGTGNMGSASWGAGDGAGGEAPLMNTPSFNSRATAQMAMKALLRVLPDLDLDALHGRVVAGDFDTGRNLRDYPTAKLEGKRMAVLGYGNIGREVAKLARAFGMNVAVHARERHREWIESEGFEFAETAEQAARDAEAITVHTGLGTKNPETGRFANAGFVGASILNALKPGAVVINFDRGEVVDPAALDEALANGRVGYVSVDADVFKDPATGALTGPLAPYIGLEARHKGKLQLLPHAAADTDHPSRVEGARQAVDQIMDVIRFKSLTNVKGTVPDGYTDAGGRTVPGVGAVSAAHLKQVSQDAALVKDMKEAAESMAAIWGALSAAYDAGQREELIRRYGAALTKAMNRYAHMAETLGLQGPFS